MKNLVSEMILPAFWLLFFMVYNQDDRKKSFKNLDRTGSKHADISAWDKTGKIKKTAYFKRYI